MTGTANLLPSAAEHPDNRPPINAEWLARMRSTKPALLRSLFEMYLAEEPKRVAALGEALANADMKQVCFLAHSLKGAAATMGMDRLRDACRELEHAAKDGGGTSALTVRFAAIGQEIEAVFTVMRETIPNP